MKKFLALGAVLAAAAGVVTSVALAVDPVVPFPAATVKQVFVAASTVMPDGTAGSWFKPGSTVVFRAYAVDGKTRKIVAADAVKYFYVTIPGQPNLKLAYDPSAPGATKGIPWTAKWVVPASYPAGPVNFKVLVKLNAHRYGQFVQIPVATSQLNVSAVAPPTVGPAAPGAATGPVAAGGSVDLSLYVDSVNGTAPAGTSSRPIGCTQTNVYHRGERVVVRSWGTDLTTGDVLTMDTVKTAQYSIAGQPAIQLAYGAHGNAGAKIWFWSNFWIVPPTFPLGETVVHVTFTTETGKTGSYDYPITIIP